jgi:hypothetical protein
MDGTIGSLSENIIPLYFIFLVHVASAEAFHAV